MRLLVTGGAGFIGSNFVVRTVNTRPQVEVVVLDALTYAGKKENLSEVADKIEFVTGSILDPELVDSLVSSVDVVVHFAAATHNDNSLIDPNLFIETNIIGTFNLIQACSKHDIRFHHISTDEVFGDLPLDGYRRFNSLSPYNPSSPYSASKAGSDMLVRAWSRTFLLKATISICTNNYGPRQHAEKFIPRTIILAASGIRPRIYGSGLNVRDWIHVDDHSDAVWRILEAGKVGKSYLIGANSQRSNLQVARTILKRLGLPSEFLEFVPDRPGHDLRYAVDASETNLELGWTPRRTSFEDGINEVISHYLGLVNSGAIDVSRIANPGLSTST